MLSNQIVPFERNRYFYGKLLTVHDFETEQRYFNNKRRLLNKALFGAGVVCGMEVLKADDTSVVVESGFALDSLGREIVLSQPLVMKLSSVEGFDEIMRTAEQGSVKSVYLCAGYSEEAAEPVHSVAKDACGDENDGSEHSKTKEQCRFYVTDKEPLEHPSTAYEGAVAYFPLWIADGIRITVSVPRNISAGEDFWLETRIDKGVTERRVSFEYTLRLGFLTSGGENEVLVKFEEPPESEEVVHRVKTRLKACEAYPSEGEILISDFQVTVGGMLKRLDKEIKKHVAISRDGDEALLRETRLEPLKKRLAKRTDIYIARVFLFVMRDYYSVDSVERLPFEQGVLTAFETQAIHLRRALTAPPVLPQNVAAAPPVPVAGEFNAGAAKVEIPSGAKAGSKHFSGMIPHGLGVGVVFVKVWADWENDMLSGDSSIFGCPFTWGAAVDKVNGLFEIGVKISKGMPQKELTFYWQAYRSPDTSTSAEEKLAIYPAVYYAARFETVKFEARGVSFADGVEWRVPEKGGKISKTGEFTASENPGLYEISVQSLVNPGLNAKAYVVIA